MSAIVVFDIDGVIRDVGNSYRRALADTVEEFTQGGYRPSASDIDALKSEGIWNNDWEASQELIRRYFADCRSTVVLDYDRIVAYFQSKYRGTDPVNWNGYICDEPLLVDLAYFNSLSAAHIPWGFFSGATRASANYILERRLGLQAPVLIAMEDAPGKPDPQGLLAAASELESQNAVKNLPIVYVGDTVADMQTIVRARNIQPSRSFLAIGVLPPHILADASEIDSYKQGLMAAGASAVLNHTRELTPAVIASIQGTGVEPV